MIDYSKSRVLIVDDSQAMCSSLRITLSNFGITRSESSNSAGEAIFRIRHREFDMIVCDYNLGDSTDGQQLLEYVRREHLIQPSVVFLMVTAERSYEKVVLCAEMAPDDYLLKPFTAETMRVRLEKVFDKKAVFSTIYAHLAESRLAEAVEECDRLLQAQSRYSVDLFRMKGELLLDLGREEEAQQLYESLLSSRAIPWARLGLAKAMRNSGNLDLAAEQLQVVIEEMPEYLAAYDVLAKVHEENGHPELAQESLANALRMSPGNLVRQSALGQVAFRNGDLETATRAFSSVVDKGRYSFSRSHNDFVNLSRVQMENGEFAKALQSLNDARSAFGTSPVVELATSTMETLIHHAANNAAASTAALDKAIAARAEAGIDLAGQTAIDLAKGCFVNGRVDEGRQLVRDMVSNYYDDTMVKRSVRQMLDAVGRGDESKALIEDSVADVIKLNNDGVLLARQGNLAGAIDLLLEAARRMPQNVQLGLNAAQALIVESDRTGWNEEHMREAQRLLGRHAAAHGDLPKFKKIRGYLKDVGLKFGVKVT